MVLTLGGGGLESFESLVYYELYSYNNPSMAGIFMVMNFAILALLVLFMPKEFDFNPKARQTPPRPNWD